MTGPDAEQDVFGRHATSMNVPPQLSSLGRMNTLASWAKAKRFSFGVSWHVVLAAIGAVLNGPSGRIRSSALGRATGRQSRSAQRTAGPVSGLWCW